MEMKVEVLAPNRPLASVEARSVTLPGSEGYLQVLPNHAALVSSLNIGYLKVEPNAGGKPLLMFVAGGYVEVADNRVVVLVNVAETPEEIDRKRAEDAKRRAQARLAKREAEVDMNRVQAALSRALGRLDFLEMVGKN